MFVEFTAAIGLVTLLVIAFAVWRAGLRAPAWFWAPSACWLRRSSTWLANIYVPGPWALLRYVPVLNLTRMPGRYAIGGPGGLGAAGAGAPVADGPMAWQRRDPSSPACPGGRTLPAPRPLYAAGVPSVYDRICADPRPVRVLELPFGVRDGVTSAGDFQRALPVPSDTHGKRLIGGHHAPGATQVPEVEAFPHLRPCWRSANGATWSAADRAEVLTRAPGFVARANLGWCRHGAAHPP
ncbi:MAG: hypothetical protein R2708_04375 [Vicinamibacterales bacterium]